VRGSYFDKERLCRVLLLPGRLRIIRCSFSPDLANRKIVAVIMQNLSAAAGCTQTLFHFCIDSRCLRQGSPISISGSLHHTNEPLTNCSLLSGHQSVLTR
jgi:hypothetical protein